MNVTLSLDDAMVAEARRIARTLDKSLNQLVREYLETLTARTQTEEDIAELRRLSADPQGSSKGWRFNREELYDRS